MISSMLLTLIVSLYLFLTRSGRELQAL